MGLIRKLPFHALYETGVEVGQRLGVCFLFVYSLFLYYRTIIKGCFDFNGCLSTTPRMWDLLRTCTSLIILDGQTFLPLACPSSDTAASGALVGGGQ